MVAIWSGWYNFVRIHTTLRVTPAMASGLSETVMDWAEIVEAMDADAPAKATPRNKRARSVPVIASEAKQPRGHITRPLGCFVARAPRNDGRAPLVQSIQLLLGVA
jgi:hypothetical protein